jgi:hypothetical protein
MEFGLGNGRGPMSDLGIGLRKPIVMVWAATIDSVEILAEA